MAAFITKACINCTECAKVCPTNSIFAGVKIYVVDTDTCESCGLCAKVCPTEAVVMKQVPWEKKIADEIKQLEESKADK
jgi:Pyruvate/2-oxoacid:ferredoxin oxidoreductase delta subunit